MRTLRSFLLVLALASSVLPFAGCGRQSCSACSNFCAPASRCGTGANDCGTSCWCSVFPNGGTYCN